MFSTLRSRLWLSYALVLLAALFLTAFLLIAYLVRSPAIYRQITSRLDAIQSVILESAPNLSDMPDNLLQSTLVAYDHLFGVRVLVYGEDWQLLADSRPEEDFSINVTSRTLLHPPSSLRDAAGNRWLYMYTLLSGGEHLLLLTPRPRIALFQILRGELFLPFTIAGLIALVLSLFVAFGLARWIGNPLQRLVEASHQMPEQEARALIPRGPREVQDLTRAFNAMTARVQASQKSQREFVANVSHELKTPLTSIQGFAQALQDGTASTPEARQQAATVIQAEAGRMHRMVIDLLDLARVDAGTLEMAREPVDMEVLLHSIVEKFAPQVQEAGVNLAVEIPALPVITGDGDRLAQVFTNLVDNALKFTPPGGSVTLQAAAPIEAGVRVDVTDTGAGIPAEALPCIFDRFYQVDPSRPGGDKHGAGLGLAVVKEIVGLHGGKMEVQSTPGKGSTFTVILPLARPNNSTLISQRKK